MANKSVTVAAVANSMCFDTQSVLLVMYGNIRSDPKDIVI
jgi:hypothetical protein